MFKTLNNVYCCKDEALLLTTGLIRDVAESRKSHDDRQLSICS